MSDRELWSIVKQQRAELDSLRREIVRAVPVRVADKAPVRGSVLMLALMDFTTDPDDGLCPSTTEGVFVGRAAPVLLGPNIKGSGQREIPTKYWRPDGQAYCVWQPMPAKAHDNGCVLVPIKCGSYFWATSNGGRYEVLSGGEIDAVDDCPCKWYGFAVWKVVDDGMGSPEWELAENRCSGCYNAEGDNAVTDRPSLEIVRDVRFTAGSINSDWPSTPAIDPPEAWMDGVERYITCCFENDVAPEVCELDCCYVVDLPTPSCEGGTSGTTSVILYGGGGGATCRWGIPDRVSVKRFGPCSESPSEGPRDLALFSVNLTDAAGLQFSYGWDGASGPTLVVVRYTLSGSLDCMATLTATRLDTTTITDGGGVDCATCADIDPMLAFPASLTLTPSVCAEVILGRCCRDGECSETTEANCSEVGDSWTEGEDCTDGCGVGRCCDGETCTETTQEACAGTWTADETCDGDAPCAPLGRCCYVVGEGRACVVSTEAACDAQLTAHDWLEGQDCTGDPCNEPCVPNGCIWVFTEFDGWQVQSTTCIEGCTDCDSPPGDPGEIGEIAYADCVMGA